MPDAMWTVEQLREFLPEWGYPPHVVSAICLELQDRIEKKLNEEIDRRHGPGAAAAIDAAFADGSIFGDSR